MTALDDALASSSIGLGPHQIKAWWRETSNEDINTNPDAVGNLTDQHDGSMTIEHSLDDALPDSVTMTTGNDANGRLTAGLNGREGLTLSTSGQRAFHASGTAGASATMLLAGNIPSTAVVGDYLLCAVLVNDASATVVQTYIDPKDNWDNLGSATVGTGLQLLLYGSKSYYTGRKPLALQADKSVTYISTTTAFWARNPLNIPLSYRVSNVAVDAETVSGTAHTRQAVLQDKGYQIGIWASASGVGPWNGTLGGSTEWIETVQTGLDLMLATSPLRNAGADTLTANTTTATATAILGTVSLEPYARPRMDAKQYFSPFNKLSPVYGFERDTADVTAAVRVLTTDGPVDTQAFKGQMQDLPLSGRTAAVVAQSKARMLLNRTIVLPIVSGNREGLGVDWLVTWIMARGGSFAGTAPSKYTRLWNTFYGSIHNHWGLDTDYNAVFRYDNFITNGSVQGPFGVTRPPTTVGPTGLPAMFAQQTATETYEIQLRPNYNMHNYPTDEFPHLFENGETGPLMADIASLANAKGRISFWVRGDPAASDPAYMTSSDSDGRLVNFTAYNVARGVPGSTYYNSYVNIYISSTSRWVACGMGATGGTFGAVTPGASYILPADGQWHFVGVWWDFIAGQYHVRVDNNFFASPSSYFATNGFNYTGDLAPTDRETRANGGKINYTFRSKLPISDLVIDSGTPFTTGATFWQDLYPLPAAPSRNATMKATFQPLQGLAQPDGVNAWDAFASLGRSSLSAYRADESDALNFLPLGYFGETAQMTPAAVVQDVERNASELEVALDNSKTRNVTTVQFKEVRQDATFKPVLDFSSAIEVPRGTSVLTLPLDTPAVEIHGAAVLDGVDYQIINLTSAQIAAPTTIPTNRHWISVNSAADGSGTVYPSVQVSAKFTSVAAGSVTIQFVNKTNKTVYIANNGQDVPFLRVLGYGLRGGDGYSTTRDTHSVTIRRERGLETELEWVQDRDTANDLSALLTGMLGDPRAEMNLTVIGDPRRKPGQLITVKDSNGTQAAGMWRILSVTSNISGGQFTQDLHVVQQYPVATWSGPDGWSIGVWGEG